MPSFAPVSLAAGAKLYAIATTSIVADVVGNVGGDHVELKTLMPPGADPHAFEPTPQDIAAVSDAHVIFANGVGLEEFLEPLLESAGATNRVVHVSHGIPLHEAEHEDGHHHDADPHTWTDPNNVVTWVNNIQQTLVALDPANASSYESNASSYEAELHELDAWVREQVSQIPQEQRKIVTDHDIFGYFVERYGFTQVGAIFPGYSTLTEPSAKELAELEDKVRDLDVKAVFVGHTVNPSLAQRVAEDTGVQLVYVYTGSLSQAGEPADSFIAYVRYNVNAIVNALK
jgi:ABC-type Zn uptake system ZnuABC Zn-binding protein ZnuA